MKLICYGGTLKQDGVSLSGCCPFEENMLAVNQDGSVWNTGHSQFERKKYFYICTRGNIKFIKNKNTMDYKMYFAANWSNFTMCNLCSVQVIWYLHFNSLRGKV